MNDHTLCSIIIRAYNEEEHIGRLLTGIMEQTLNNFEIILVDSGSSDATVAIASRFPVQIVHIDPEHFTFGRSLNLGCAAANGRFLVVASAHVFPVYDDWLEHLIAPFDDQGVALVYGKQRGVESSRFSEHQQFARMYPEVSNFNQQHPLCNNANAAVRRDLWERHLYDESLSGLEDLEWATWALSEGFHIAYSAEAVVHHVHEESPHQVFRRYEREAIALAQIRPEERFSIIDFVRLYLSNVRGDLIQALREGNFWEVFREILWFRWMQFWGTYVGFRHAGPVTDEVIQAFYYPQKVAQTSNTNNVLGRNPIEYGEAQKHVTGEPNHEG
jgi:glycosyltransferase involved in cell wall biosynthesis